MKMVRKVGERKDEPTQLFEKAAKGMGKPKRKAAKKLKKFAKSLSKHAKL
jgi:hypothetical protein